jgi:hypothetical protein
MSDQEIITNQNNEAVAEPGEKVWDYNPKSDGTVHIPVRMGQNRYHDDSVRDDVADEEVVREYEQRYQGRLAADEDVYQQRPYDEYGPRKSKFGWNSYWDSAKKVKLPPRHRYNARSGSMPQAVDDSERLWAALAHASGLLTLLAVLGTGPGVVVALLIPLGIYFIFRRRSEYVAFHALQAFTMQTVTTIGVAITVIVGMLVLVPLIILSGLFSFVLVGIPFLIMFVLMAALLAIVGFTAVFVILPIYSMIAAHAAWNGRAYRYPYVADWVDDQLTNGMLSSVA